MSEGIESTLLLFITLPSTEEEFVYSLSYLFPRAIP